MGLSGARALIFSGAWCGPGISLIDRTLEHRPEANDRCQGERPLRDKTRTEHQPASPGVSARGWGASRSVGQNSSAGFARVARCRRNRPADEFAIDLVGSLSTVNLMEPRPN